MSDSPAKPDRGSVMLNMSWSEAQALYEEVIVARGDGVASAKEDDIESVKEKLEAQL